MKKAKIFILTLMFALCAASLSGVFASAASLPDLNFSVDFWSGQAAQSDNFLLIKPEANRGWWGCNEYVDGNYTLEYEFKDMGAWVDEGTGSYRNSNFGGETWIVLGAKKQAGNFQNFIGQGGGGICLRITEGSIWSYEYVGGPYPFFQPNGTAISDGWLPAGELTRYVDARLVYRFVVKADIRRIEIWAGFKDVSESDLQFKYRAYMTYGDSMRTDGHFFMDMSSDTMIDNFKIEKGGSTVLHWTFDDGKIPDLFETNYPLSYVSVVNSSKTLVSGALNSQFYLLRDHSSEYMFDGIFYAKSGASGDIFRLAFGLEGSKQNLINIARNTQTLSLSGAPQTGSPGGGTYDLTQGAYFRVAMAQSGKLEIYVINKSLRCPMQYCPQTLLNSYQLPVEEFEGNLGFVAQGTVTINDFTVLSASIGADSDIRGLTINEGGFAVAKTGQILQLSAAFDMTSPLAQNQGLYWSVVSGEGEIIGGNKLKINGSGAIIVRAVSTYDPDVSATATVYAPEIQKVSVDSGFDKKIGGEIRLKATVVCRPNVDNFYAVKWQVIEGDASITDGNLLKIGNGQITVKAISLFDPAKNAEYTFTAGSTDNGGDGSDPTPPPPASSSGGCGAVVTNGGNTHLGIIAVLSASPCVLFVKKRKTTVSNCR